MKFTFEETHFTLIRHAIVDAIAAQTITFIQNIK